MSVTSEEPSARLTDVQVGEVLALATDADSVKLTVPDSHRRQAATALGVDPLDAQTDLSMRLVAEVWFYPDGSRIVELSAKAPPFEAFQDAAELFGASGGQPAVGPG